MAKLPEVHECPVEEPFVPTPCADAVVEVTDGFIADKPENPSPGKKRLDRTMRMTDGMSFGEDLCEQCFPCPKPGTLDAATALALAVMFDQLMCCFPYELDPDNCKGGISRQVKKGEIFYQGHPAVTGGKSKMLRDCPDYVAAFPSMAPMLGAMTNLYGANSMPYIDWDCMNMQGVEKMLQLFAHIRDTLKAYALTEDPALPLDGTPFEPAFAGVPAAGAGGAAPLKAAAVQVKTG